MSWVLQDAQELSGGACQVVGKILFVFFKIMWNKTSKIFKLKQHKTNFILKR